MVYLRTQLPRFSAQECRKHQSCGLTAQRGPMCLRMAKGLWGPLPSLVALSIVCQFPTVCPCFDQGYCGVGVHPCFFEALIETSEPRG